MEEQRIAKAHKLVVNNRKTSMVTGVLDVLSFDLNIDSIAYSSSTPAEKAGENFLSRLFR